MKIENKHIKLFPAYEEVFAEDIEQARKHFLPICSLNLQAIYPTEDQWLHFVSVKEIGEGCVGQETHDYHSQYCKEDMYAFDVVGNKYKFAGDWNYFIAEQVGKQDKNCNEDTVKAYRANLSNFESRIQLEQWLQAYKGKISDTIYQKLLSKYKYFISGEPDKKLVDRLLDELEEEAKEYDSDYILNIYQKNEDTYKVGKAYFEKHGKIYPMTIGNYSKPISTIEELEQHLADSLPYGVEYPEFGGILDDIQFQSKESISVMEEYDIPMEEMNSFEGTNLIELPYDAEGNIFEYIGSFTGYLFQCYGADAAYLFYNKELKKAVMCLEYT